MIVIADSSKQETFFLLLKVSPAFWGKSVQTYTRADIAAMHKHPLLCKRMSSMHAAFIGTWVLCSFLH